MGVVRYKPLHVGISVSNIEDAAAWFEDVLGFTLREKSEFTPMGFRVAFLDNGGGFEVELFENKETKPAPKEASPKKTKQEKKQKKKQKKKKRKVRRVLLVILLLLLLLVAGAFLYFMGVLSVLLEVRLAMFARLRGFAVR